MRKFWILYGLLGWTIAVGSLPTPLNPMPARPAIATITQARGGIILRLSSPTQRQSLKAEKGMQVLSGDLLQAGKGEKIVVQCRLNPRLFQTIAGDGLTWSITKLCPSI